MIHDDLFLPVKERVRARGLPSAIEFTYGEPQIPVKVGGSRLFMHIDDEAGDQIKPTTSQRPNPKLVSVRAVGVRVVIFAHDTRQGAHRGHHEAEALIISQMVHAALDQVVKAANTRWTPGRYGFVAVEGSEGWAGRAYEMRFTVDTAIEDVTWKGAAAPEYTFTDATTTHTRTGAATVSLPNATTRIE